MPKHLQQNINIGYWLTGTSFATGGATTSVGLDLGVGVTATVILARIDFTGTLNGTIQGSVNGSTYTPLSTLLTNTTGVIEVSFTNVMAYRYYRYYSATNTATINAIYFYDAARISDVVGAIPNNLTAEKVKGVFVNSLYSDKNMLGTYSNANKTIGFNYVPPTTLCFMAQSTAVNNMANNVPAELIFITLATAGTYFVEFTTSAELSRRGASGTYTIYQNGVALQDTARIIDNSSTNSTAFTMRWSVYTCGVVTTTATNQKAAVWVVSSAKNNTVTTNERVLTAIRLS
jgi:hypothetical protein